MSPPRPSSTRCVMTSTATACPLPGGRTTRRSPRARWTWVVWAACEGYELTADLDLRHQRQRRPRRGRCLLERGRRLGAHRQRLRPVHDRVRGRLARRLEPVHRQKHAGRRGPVRSRGRGRQHPPLRGRRRFRDGKRRRRRPRGAQPRPGRVVLRHRRSDGQRRRGRRGGGNSFPRAA